MNILPLSEAKAYLAERVEREHERILVTRNGRPSFVAVSPDDLGSVEETLDILRDRDLVEFLARSRSEAASASCSRCRPSETEP